MSEQPEYVPFTKDMIGTHTILVPTMLHIGDNHFKMHGQHGQHQDGVGADHAAHAF